MLNKIVVFLLVFVSLLGASVIEVSSAEFSISAQSAIVMNAHTGEVLFAKNAHEKRGIASTTKIMTALLAIESGLLDRQYTVSSADVYVEGTSAGLKAGDIVSLDVLVKGMLLESGNDAANVTASVFGGKERFAALMNSKAKELGMSSTSFKNPSGLTEEGHYSTAFDMALLASAAIKNNVFREYCGAKSFRVSYGLPEKNVTYYNHNKFLSMYDGAFGIKTGFTKASGRCLVSAVQKDGAILVGVTLNAPDDWNDHKKMYDYAFGRLRKVNVDFDCSEIKVHVVGGKKNVVEVEQTSPLYFYATNNFGEYKTAVYITPFLYAGVNKNDFVGRAVVLDSKGKEIAFTYLYAKNGVVPYVTEKEKGSIPFYDKIIKILKEGLSKRQT